MSAHEVIRALRQGWLFRLPGEPSVYWNPGAAIPAGHMEIWGVEDGRLVWRLVPIPKEHEERILDAAWGIRRAAVKALRA